MSVPPATGTFTIKSVSQGLAPTGISPGTASPPPPTSVVINGDVTTWNIVQQDGFSVFQFAIGDYSYTGVTVNSDNSTTVTATTDVTQNLNWFARYFESQDAYTIETNSTLGNAWTVSSTSVANAPIDITSIPTTGSSQFAPSSSQLFRFYSA